MFLSSSKLSLNNRQDSELSYSDEQILTCQASVTKGVTKWPVDFRDAFDGPWSYYLNLERDEQSTHDPA